MVKYTYDKVQQKIAAARSSPAIEATYFNTLLARCTMYFQVEEYAKAIDLLPTLVANCPEEDTRTSALLTQNIASALHSVRVSPS